VVAAIQEFKRDHALDPGSITRVVIRGAPRIMEERHGTRTPQDVLGGQYSLPFTTAVALTRDLSDPLVYDADAIRDPVVRELARTIELQPLEEAFQEAPGVWPAEVLLDCAGRRHTLRTRPYKGSPSNPFTWDEACEKFRRYTRSIVDPQRATSIIGAVGRLEQVADMASLARLVART
jgi:2-methylcitrate dehydratase PrpD